MVVTANAEKTLTAPPARRRRRVVLAVLAAVVVLAVVSVGWSYARALTGPGHDSAAARSVEWLREHHGGWLVDWVERHHPAHEAKVGGTPSADAVAPRLAGSATPRPLAASVLPERPAAGTLPAPSAPPATTPTPVASTAAAAAAAGGTAPPAAPTVTTMPWPPGDRLQPPAPLVSPAAQPFAGEGTWRPFGPAVGGQPAAYTTVVRPDDTHTSSVIGVVWFDPHALSFRQYPGLKVPGAPWDRPPNVAPADQAALLAAFEGGFRLNDSHGGMILGGRTLKPMRDGGATLAIDRNGVPMVGAWGRDLPPADQLDSARQNLDLIVDNGQADPSLVTDPNRKWGFTGPANNAYVWRSGVGVRPDGSLVWVGGPGLSIATLADQLVRLGVVRGMQLDINKEWVQLTTYAADASGTVHGQRLLKDMRGPDDRWLTPDTRDFIAVSVR